MTDIDEIQALENSMLFSALEAARLGLCVVNKDGDIVILTSEFAKKIGQSPAELLGRNARRLFASEHFFVSHFAELIDVSAGNMSCEVSHSMAGEKTMLFLQASTTSDLGFGVFRVLSILDIRDFGLTPSYLTDTRRHLEVLRSAVMIVDLARSDQPISYVNRRFEEIFGANAQEVVGRSWRELQGFERDQGGLEELRSATASLRPCHVTLRSCRKNGDAFSTELFVTPVFNGLGNATHLVCVQSDLEERRYGS